MESNHQPTDYKSVALPIELYQQIGQHCNVLSFLTNCFLIHEIPRKQKNDKSV